MPKAINIEPKRYQHEPRDLQKHPLRHRIENVREKEVPLSDFWYAFYHSLINNTIKQIIKQSMKLQAQIPKLQKFQFLQNLIYRIYTKYKIKCWIFIFRTLAFWGIFENNQIWFKQWPNSYQNGPNGVPKAINIERKWYQREPRDLQKHPLRHRIENVREKEVPLSDFWYVFYHSLINNTVQTNY